MRKIYLSLFAVSVGFALAGCLSDKSDTEYGALDYVGQPEITVKTPEEWLPLISAASLANEDITSYLDTRVCIPTSSQVCDENNECKEAEPSVFLFVSSFEPSTGETLALTTNIYRCDEINGCEKNEYSSYFDAESKTEKLQIRNHEISISEGQYTDQSIVGINTVTNSGKCYYRDELNIAEVKVESTNQYDKICEIDESHFGIDWVGINQTFTLKQDAELRASPITMDCNVLDIVPQGEQISIHTETNGGVNPDEKYVWIEITYNGQTGWIRGDYLDDQFQL